MAKNTKSPIITEGKFLVIRSSELDEFMTKNYFSDVEKNKVRKIQQRFSDAYVIFYFFKLFDR